MNKQSVRREGGLAFEMGAILAAVALCIATYLIASQFGVPSLEAHAGADTAAAPLHN
jgi:hypothetical protein